MNCDVKSHELPEILVLEAELVCVVSAIVKSTVSGWDLAAVAILVVEDD